MVIARIPYTVPDAHQRAAATVHRAETAGYRHVTATPEQDHGAYVIEADEPNQPGR